MKHIAFTLAAIACMTACGDDSAETDPTGSDGSGIRLQTSIQPNTREIGVYVFARRDRSNIIVTCTSLLTGNPLDERYNVLQSGTFPYPGDNPDSVTLANITTEDPVIIYVEARDARDNVIGEGCAENVEIEDGGTRNVNVTVYTAS